MSLPENAGEYVHVYNVVAARRLLNVGLIWQTPTLSMAGQAFLFSISLSANSSRASRIISSSLCILFSLMTLQLIVKHRQTDASDRAWLEAFENTYFAGFSKALQVGTSGFAHGSGERQRRRATSPQMGLLNWAAGARSSQIWAWGFLLISIIALAILFLAIFTPRIFLSS